jgi:hypothetical protein
VYFLSTMDTLSDEWRKRLTKMSTSAIVSKLVKDAGMSATELCHLDRQALLDVIANWQYSQLTGEDLCLGSLLEVGEEKHLTEEDFKPIVSDSVGDIVHPPSLSGGIKPSLPVTTDLALQREMFEWQKQCWKEEQTRWKEEKAREQTKWNEEQARLREERAERVERTRAEQEREKNGQRQSKLSYLGTPCVVQL